MATITATSSVGVYIVEEENGQIAGNTPGGIDLAALVNGDTYVYADSVIQFEHRLTFNYESDEMRGHNVFRAGGAGQHGHNTYEGDRGYAAIIIEVAHANASLWENFAKQNNRTGDGAKFLIQQYASNTFREFPNATGTQKKYLPVIVRGVTFSETGGKNASIIGQIALEEVQTS